MTRRNAHSISGKLTRTNVVVSGTALLLAYFAFLVYDLYTLRKDLVGSLSTDASIVGADCVTALLFDDRPAAVNTLTALRETPQVLWAVVVRSDGSKFAQYSRTPSVEPDLDHTLAPGDLRRSWMRDHGVLLGSRILYEGKPIGAVYMLAETSALKYGTLEFGLLALPIVAFCFAMSLIVTSATRNLVTQPLTGLAETAQIVSRKKDYSVRATIPPTSDELSFLVRSFNEMLEQIQERDRALEESRDILEQRVQERTAELTAANKELEAFSYSVAHDLRGPLQHIGNIGFILRSMLESSRPEERELVEKLFDSSKRMSNLIDNLLNLSRASSAPLRRAPIDLGQMSGSILERLCAENPGRRVRIVVARGARALADEGLMEVVMQNLLSNAWKYTARCFEPAIEFGFDNQNGSTVYFVRDNGAGFDPRYADRLFRPFQRLHSSSEFPGTGIGLATASRIINRHGGRIWAESAVDKGAKFSFTLPYTSEQEVD
jgi:signal transduction histidine kinase